MPKLSKSEELNHSSTLNQLKEEIVQLQSAVNKLQQHQIDNSEGKSTPDRNINHLNKKITALEDAFTVLSDTILDELDEMWIAMTNRCEEIEERCTVMDQSFCQLEKKIHQKFANGNDMQNVMHSHILNLQTTSKKLNNTIETCSINIESIQSSIGHLESRDTEMKQKVEEIDVSHIQVTDWVQRFKKEFLDLAEDVHIIKEETNSHAKSTAGDIAAIVEECSAIRKRLQEIKEVFLVKLTSFSSTLEKQRGLDRDLTTQKLEEIIENHRISFCEAQQKINTIAQKTLSNRKNFEANLDLYYCDIKSLKEKIKTVDDVLTKKFDSQQNEIEDWYSKYCTQSQAFANSLNSLASMMNLPIPQI